MNATETAYVEDLKSVISDLTTSNTRLTDELTLLRQQLDWLRRQLFGQKSEKIIEKGKEQQLCFEGFELKEELPLSKPVAAHTRSPKRQGGDAITLPADLPVKETLLDLPEEEKVCPETGKPLVKIGEEVTHKLAHRPGSFYLRRFIRPKYALPEGDGIRIAELPDTILPRCRADESLLAEIAVRKFADHLPLYRISEEFSREKIGISRQLLSQWIVNYGLALEPLYQLMNDRLLKGGNLFVDEVPVPLQAPGKGKVDQAYLWLMAEEKCRVYHFRTNRQHKNAYELLEGYQGVFHSDKYGAYEQLAKQPGIIWCPCWSHIRRHFFEADTGDPLFREWVLRQIRYLFLLERVAWARSEEERLQIRQDKEVPIIDRLITAIKERLHSGKLLPKSKLYTALGYFCSLIPYLKNYTKYPRARLDNNTAERAVRPLAIGRKNWLFFGSPRGGKAGAILLSLIQTCRGIGVNPREYMEDVSRRMMGHNSQRLEELLPDRWAESRRELELQGLPTPDLQSSA